MTTPEIKKQRMIKMIIILSQNLWILNPVTFRNFLSLHNFSNISSYRPKLKGNKTEIMTTRFYYEHIHTSFTFIGLGRTDRAGSTWSLQLVIHRIGRHPSHVTRFLIGRRRQSRLLCGDGGSCYPLCTAQSEPAAAVGSGPFHLARSDWKKIGHSSRKVEC